MTKKKMEPTMLNQKLLWITTTREKRKNHFPFFLYFFCLWNVFFYFVRCFRAIFFFFSFSAIVMVKWFFFRFAFIMFSNGYLHSFWMMMLNKRIMPFIFTCIKIDTFFFLRNWVKQLRWDLFQRNALYYHLLVYLCFLSQCKEIFLFKVQAFFFYFSRCVCSLLSFGFDNIPFALK